MGREGRRSGRGLTEKYDSSRGPGYDSAAGISREKMSIIMNP